MQIYIDGEFYSKEDAKVSVFDHGLLYGDGVFEGIRVYAGRVFELDPHIDRLYASAQALALEIPLPRVDLVEAMLETIRRNDIHNGYVRLVVTRGDRRSGAQSREVPQGHRVLHRRRHLALSGRGLRAGVQGGHAGHAA